MYMIFIIGCRADAIRPSAPFAEARNNPLNHRPPRGGELNRIPPHPLARFRSAFRIRFDERFTALIVFAIDRRSIIPMQACAVGAERDMPRGSRRIELLRHDESLLCEPPRVAAGNAP